MEKRKRNPPRWYICYRSIQMNGWPSAEYKVLRGPYYDHVEARRTLFEKFTPSMCKYPLAIYTRTDLAYYGYYPNSANGNNRLLKDEIAAKQAVERLRY